MAQLSALFIRAAELGVLSRRWSATCPTRWPPAPPTSTPSWATGAPESFQAMIQTWATLHGITCLDAYGQFDWMTDEAREALFVSTLRTAALAAGIPIE